MWEDVEEQIAEGYKNEDINIQLSLKAYLSKWVLGHGKRQKEENGKFMTGVANGKQDNVKNEWL